MNGIDMKTLKERVLEASYEAKYGAGHSGRVMDNGWTVRGYDHEHHYVNGGVHLVVKPETPDDDPVWPPAAQVLGIREDEKDPFEAFINSKTSSMVWELCESFFLNGMGWANSDMGDALTESDKIRFENVWAENAVLVHSIAKSLAIPPDTLKEDGGDRTKTENDYLSALKTLIVGSCRAMDDDRLSEAVYNHVSPFFLAIVRSVPNKEDRELVKNHFFSVGILNGNTPDNVIAAFKRLCGMEVGNG